MTAFSMGIWDSVLSCSPPESSFFQDVVYRSGWCMYCMGDAIEEPENSLCTIKCTHVDSFKNGIVAIFLLLDLCLHTVKAFSCTVRSNKHHISDGSCKSCIPILERVECNEPKEHDFRRLLISWDSFQVSPFHCNETYEVLWDYLPILFSLQSKSNLFLRPRTFPCKKLVSARGSSKDALFQVKYSHKNMFIVIHI